MNFVTKLDLFDQQQENRLFSISDASDRWQFSSTTKVTYDHEMGTDLVGVLVLYSNATVLLNRISLELMIMASGMLLMLVTLWLALRSAGDRLLSQPLQKLGDYYQNVNLTSINRQKSITWKDDNNELTTLADESKKMLSRLHQSTQELLLAKNQIDLIIDTMGEGIAVLDSEGQITLVNQRFETMSGYSQQSLARKQLSELFTSKRDEESLPTILRDLSVPLATLFTHNQDKFDLLTQESPLSTLIIDENGIIISSNKAFTMLSGWKSEQLQGETLEPLLPESIRDTHQQLFNQYIHSPEARSMGGRLLPLVTAKGKLKELEIGLIPLQKEEKSYVMVVLHDPIAQRIWEFFKITTLGRLIQGSTDRVQLQYQLQQENGNTLPVEVSIATMNQQIDASTDASAVLVVHDITDKIKQAHREQYEAFQSGLAEMSATVLHNIGNVVTGVSSAALSCSKRVEHLGQINHAFTQLDQQLQQGTLNHQEYVEKAQMVDNIIKEIREGKSGRRGLSRLSADINEGIKHITDMIRSFRENSQDRVTRSHFNLHEMVKDTVNIVEGQLNKYKIELKIDISEKIELNLPRNLTIQMMLNLIKKSYCQIWCSGPLTQAAIRLSEITSIPSLNFTPSITLAR